MMTEKNFERLKVFIKEVNAVDSRFNDITLWFDAWENGEPKFNHFRKVGKQDLKSIEDIVEGKFIKKVHFKKILRICLQVFFGNGTSKTFKS